MQEQRVDAWLTRAGLRGWQRNFVVVIFDGTKIEVDFGWLQHKVALEVSPFFTHGSRATQERDIVRRRLLIQMGWTVVEATDSDLVDSVAFQRVAMLLRVLVE
jgi:very-short-patch-repair endonuclease